MLSNKIGKYKFKTPILTASGTYGYGDEVKDLVDINNLGGFIYSIYFESSNDASISVSVSGGSFPFSFSWSGPNSFSSPFQNINNLVPGNYNLYLVDANGCISECFIS